MAEEALIENQKIEQYKTYMQDLSNIGTRHETARGFSTFRSCPRCLLS